MLNFVGATHDGVGAVVEIAVAGVHGAVGAQIVTAGASAPMHMVAHGAHRKLGHILVHSRAQQHQEGVRDKVMNNVIVDSWRCDPLTIGESQWDQDGLNELSDKTLPHIMTAAIEGTNLAYHEDHRPTTNLRLPAADEASLGQFFQMMMLATVVEGRLIGINPYGQPGVEKYKKYMNQFLRQPVTI